MLATVELQNENVTEFATDSVADIAILTRLSVPPTRSFDEIAKSSRPGMSNEAAPQWRPSDWMFPSGHLIHQNSAQLDPSGRAPTFTKTFPLKLI